MRTRFSRVALSVFFTAFAFALGFGMQSGSAAGDVYQPPLGWRRVLGSEGGFGAWVHPGDRGFKQNVNVLAQRFSGPLSDYAAMSAAGIRSQIPGVKMGGVQRATVCGSHPSMYLTYAANVRGKVLIYEQMLTIWQGVAYVATYTRQSNQPSLPEARQSLTTLCGGLPPAQGRYVRSAVPGPNPTPSATSAPPVYATPTPLGSVAPTVTPRLGP